MPPATANGARRRDSYTVAIISALSLEMSAVRYLLDREHPSLPLQPGDSNLYILGELSGHNVVLAWLAGSQGKGAAATVATNLSRSFPDIEWRFLVGIGGGVPSDKHDIRLGDVVVSMPEGQHGGVVQYDLGKDYDEEFKLKGFLLPPPTQLRNAVGLMRSNHFTEENKIEEFLQQMLQKGRRLSVYRRPPYESDVLFAADSLHKEGQTTCDKCDITKIVDRKPREYEGPEIHYGLIASGDRVMKSAAKRQEVVRRVGEILCFEMEAAGIATEYPCVVLRGISDYADSHKTDLWHYYAAATAAATAKELLMCIPGCGKEECNEKEASVSPAAGQEKSDAGPDAIQFLQDCAKSLAFEEMNDRTNDVNITAAEGTCRWLLQHQVCADWSAQDRALLWIKGKPGSGKSTLLRYFLDLVKRASAYENKAVVLSFFFHGRGVELQKTPFGLFRSVLFQLLNQMPESAAGLVQLFRKRCETMGTHGKDWQWYLRELQDAFRAAVANVLDHQTVWLFIDALDECGKQSAIELVRHFKSLLGGIPPKKSQFLICFTCRHYPILHLDSTFEIILEKENSADVCVYVRDTLSSLGEAATSSLTDLITTQADGVFMWASLQVKRVFELELDGASLTKIEREVSSTPPDLHSLYLGLVHDMNEKASSRKLFEWICFAKRPLSVEELRWALATETNHDSSIKSLKQAECSDEYIQDSERMERRIKTLSCGLAEAISSSNKRLVQFIHQSVRDFFVETGIAALNDHPNNSETDANRVAGMAHYQISRTCIRYLLLGEIARSAARREELISHFPLLHYAATSWIQHAKESEATGVLQDDLLDYFNWPSSTHLQGWLRVVNRIEHFSEESSQEKTSMLHVLSQSQLISPLRLALAPQNQANVDVNTRDYFGRTPLLWACLKGNLTAVEMLLDTDHIDVNARDTSGWSPLFWAVANRHQAVVELLLNTKSIDVDFQSFAGRSPLSWAAEKGYANAAQSLILDGGADVDLADREGKTPLYLASVNGYTHVVRLLLKHGASFEIADIGETPLQVACRQNHCHIVQLLLEAGADAEVKDAIGQTPLHHACRNGSLEMIRLLLKNRANIEAVTTEKRTPMHLAARDGAVKTMELLLEHGASIDAVAADGQTPLIVASDNYEWVAAAFLVKEGADICQKSAPVSTSLLELAAEFDDVDLARSLLEKGAAVEAEAEGFYFSPLHQAASCGSIGVVKLLLQYGARVSALDHEDITPLQIAVETGDEVIVGLMIDDIYESVVKLLG